MVMGPGENAGAVDVGDGLAIAFKVESHNHPSAVEPFQGAATGVGGILRDVFAIGARPIAILDSLRFGELDSARSRYLLDRAVAGIGHYGNSIGVATVGGEIYFEGPYEHNCLVNAMCLGIAPKERLIRSAAAGVGNHLVLFGALTGRDGIGGASVLASRRARRGRSTSARACRSATRSRRRSCSSASLELLDRGLLASLQDLGAAGLTSSASEMASKGEVGIDIDVDRVPLREAGMEPFEIMISESQERMLCVVEPDKLDAGARRLREVGGPRHGDRRGHRHAPAAGARRAARSSATCRSRRSSTTARSTTSSPRRRPSRSTRRRRRSCTTAPRRRRRCSRCSASPNIASKRWAFEQYDSLVGSRTARRAGRGRRRGAVARARRRRGRDRRRRSTATAAAWPCDPYTGAVEAVLECAQNLACVGAEPLGLTNCLNFGNPEKPHIAWQLTRAVEGSPTPAARSACRSWAATSRSTTRAPRARSTRRRSSAWSASSPTRRAPPAGLASRGRRDRCWSARSRPALAGSELEKLRGEPRRRPAGGRPRASRRARSRAVRALAARGLRRRRPTTSPRAAWPWRSPSAAIAGGLGARGRRRRVALTTTSRCSARGRAACVVAVPRRSVDEARRRSRQDTAVV